MAVSKYTERIPEAERRHNQLLDSLAKKYRAAYRKAILRAYRQALEAFDKNGIIDNQIYVDHEKALYDISIKAYTAGIFSGARRHGILFKNAGWVDIDQAEEIVKAVINSDTWARDKARNSAIEMVKTTRKVIDGIIKKPRAQNDINGFFEAIKDALKEAKELSIWRSILAPQVIMQQALNFSGQETARHTTQKTGRKISKQWITRRDEKVRETHRPMDRVTVPYDAFFEVPTLGGGTAFLEFPGDDRAPIDTWINCRCTVRHKLEG